MHIVTFSGLTTISETKRLCGSAREQSLASNPQARASCTQAAGRAGAGPSLRRAAPTPPFALAAGQAEAAP